MREAKPWYRKSNDSWYVEIHGRQVRLAKGKANRPEAVKQFHLLMAGTKPAAPKSLTAAEVCDLFLRHSEREHEAETFDWHKHYLQSFCDRCGHLRAADLIPFHLTSWLDGNPSWKAARRHATGVAKRAFAWCREQGLITADPFEDVAVPKGGRRERVLTEDARAVGPLPEGCACRPLPYTFGPGWPSTVSSPTKSTGPSGITWSSRKRASAHPSSRPDHSAADSTRR